jgi:plastocyanin
MIGSRSKLTFFMLVILAGGCGGGTEEPQPVDNVVASVTISATRTSLPPGQTSQLVAIPKNAAGASISGQTATWSSSSNAVATVSSTGLVNAVANGAATMTGTVAGKSGTLLINVETVNPQPTATVNATASSTFTPLQVDITVGGTVTWQFAAGTAHNVNFQGSATGKPANIPDSQGTSVARTFTAAGTFPYECTLHVGMTGTVIVH